MQRVYEWRASIASAAVAAINAFFKDNDYETVEARKEFATEQLKNYVFLYTQAEGDDVRVRILVVTAIVLISQHTAMEVVIFRRYGCTNFCLSFPRCQPCPGCSLFPPRRPDGAAQISPSTFSSCGIYFFIAAN
jgi:hypothetical protein